MQTAVEPLHNFRVYAADRIQSGGAQLERGDLLDEWRHQQTPDQTL